MVPDGVASAQAAPAVAGMADPTPAAMKVHCPATPIPASRRAISASAVAVAVGVARTFYVTAPVTGMSILKFFAEFEIQGVRKAAPLPRNGPKVGRMCHLVH
jgi:hypothetical protein